MHTNERLTGVIVRSPLLNGLSVGGRASHELADPSHFARVIRRRVGQTPLKIRRRRSIYSFDAVGAATAGHCFRVIWEVVSRSVHQRDRVVQADLRWRPPESSAKYARELRPIREAGPPADFSDAQLPEDGRLQHPERHLSPYLHQTTSERLAKYSKAPVKRPNRHAERRRNVACCQSGLCATLRDTVFDASPAVEVTRCRSPRIAAHLVGN